MYQALHSEKFAIDEITFKVTQNHQQQCTTGTLYFYALRVCAVAKLFPSLIVKLRLCHIPVQSLQ